MLTFTCWWKRHVETPVFDRSFPLQCGWSDYEAFPSLIGRGNVYWAGLYNLVRTWNFLMLLLVRMRADAVLIRSSIRFLTCKSVRMWSIVCPPSSLVSKLVVHVSISHLWCVLVCVTLYWSMFCYIWWHILLFVRILLILDLCLLSLTWYGKLKRTYFPDLTLLACGWGILTDCPLSLLLFTLLLVIDCIIFNFSLQMITVTVVQLVYAHFFSLTGMQPWREGNVKKNLKTSLTIDDNLSKFCNNKNVKISTFSIGKCVTPYYHKLRRYKHLSKFFGFCWNWNYFICLTTLKDELWEAKLKETLSKHTS